MNKLWKIGTNIEHYIDEIFKFSKKYGDTFFVYHKKNDGKDFCIDFHKGNKIYKTKATCSQFIRVLFALKIIECNEFDSFQKESDMINNRYYQINIHSKDELKKCIVNNLIITTIRIYENRKTLFPSEIKLIFSLLAVVFSMENTQNKKTIERQIAKHTISDIMPYYETVALLIKSSNNYESLVKNKKIHKYIVGMTSGVKKIMNSISSYSSQYNISIYSEVNLNEQLKSKAFTIGHFIKKYILDKDTKLEIPIYQRKYIWTSELVELLLLDIMNIKEGMTHYIGNIILKGESDGFIHKYKIIDGQQRITTLILIAKVIFDFGKFNNKNEWYISKKINNVFAIKEPNNYCDAVNAFIRIEGNDDHDMFRLIATSKLKDESIKKMKSQIYDNYLKIFDWFDVYINTKKKFHDFQYNFLNRLTTVIINAKGSNEFKIFEKLNTGSIPLTPLELFKNYAIDKFSSNISEKKLQKLFEDSIESHFVETKNKGQAIESFMITYIRSNQSILNKDTIFNQFKDLIETKYVDNDIGINIKTVLEKIGKEIELYMTISKYDKYTNRNSYAYKYSDFLYMLDGRSVYYPIIIKLMKLKFDDYTNPTYEEICEFRKFMRILEIYEVRLQIGTYRGQSLSGKIEEILLNITDNITPNQFWGIVRGERGSSNEISSIDTMVEVLKTQSIKNKPAKLIMTRIENYFHLTNNWDVDEHDVDFQAMYEKPSNREHLLPQEWEEHWAEDLKKWLNISSIETIEENIYKYINFIGNAFPIPEWSNKGIKNLSLKEKIYKIKNKIYSKKLLLLNGIDGRLDAIGDSFTYEDIKRRSEQIAEIAREIWADFPSN